MIPQVQDLGYILPKDNRSKWPVPQAHNAPGIVGPTKHGRPEEANPNPVA